MGKRRISDENLVWAHGAVQKCRSIRCLPEEESWCRDSVNGVKCFPWDEEQEGDDDSPPRELRPDDVIQPSEGPWQEPEPRDADEDPVPRGVKIQLKHLRQYGFTQSCRKCRMLLSGDRSQPQLAHSSECRRRVLEEMRKSSDEEEGGGGREEKRGVFQKSPRPAPRCRKGR